MSIAASCSAKVTRECRGSGGSGATPLAIPLSTHRFMQGCRGCPSCAAGPRGLMADVLVLLLFFICAGVYTIPTESKRAGVLLLGRVSEWAVTISGTSGS
jgi:hypothetical protein